MIILEKISTIVKTFQNVLEKWQEIFTARSQKGSVWEQYFSRNNKRKGISENNK